MILELRKLTCGYGRRAVLKNVDLTVALGENLCLLGPNGVGKTTLFRTILGAIEPMAGDVLIDGKNITRQSRRERARMMAYVPQAHTAPFPFHVLDVVLTGRTAHIPLTAAPTAHDEQVARAALERMEISDLADRPYTELSGGERQLVLIARALAQEPKVLIMDEPSSHLDFGNQARLLSLIKSLVHERDLAVLMSSHFPNHAFACATRVGLVKDGHLAALGSPGEVLTESSLEDIYGIPVRILEGDPETDPTLKVCAARALLPIDRRPDRSHTFALATMPVATLYSAAYYGRKESGVGTSWDIYDRLIEGIAPGATASACLVGSTWTVVDSDGLGLAMTYRAGAHDGTPLTSLAGRSLRDLASHITSWDLRNASLGMAAINAYYNAPHRAQEWLAQPLAELRSVGSFTTTLDDVAGKKVTVIGHFPGLETMRQRCQLTILERNPQDGDLPDFAAEYVLPEQDFVFITGTALTNKTLPRLLALSAGATVGLVGPSVPLVPWWFELGVDLLGGTVVMDKAGVWKACLEGAHRGVFDAGAWMVDIRPDDLRPGSGNRN